MRLFLATLCALVAAGVALNPNRTVTEEVWFDVQVQDIDGDGDDYTGRFTVGVFGEVAPMTALNFVSISNGYKMKNNKLTYKNSPVHRIVPDFVIQMGDITSGDGTGGTSIYGDRFNDEEFTLSHRAAGMVSMANHGADTNGSQFFVILNPARWLDGKHVVFGKVIRGMDALETISEVESDHNTAVPKKTVKIIDCGVNRIAEPYELTEKQMNTAADI